LFDQSPELHDSHLKGNVKIQTIFCQFIHNFRVSGN
jgi:hypothetical protein